MSEYIVDTAPVPVASPLVSTREQRHLAPQPPALLTLPPLRSWEMEEFYGPHHERPSGLCMVTGVLCQSKETMASGLTLSRIREEIRARYAWAKNPSTASGRKASRKSGEPDDEALHLVNEGVRAGVKHQILRTEGAGQSKICITPKLRQMFPEPTWVSSRAEQFLGQNSNPGQGQASLSTVHGPAHAQGKKDRAEDTEEDGASAERGSTRTPAPVPAPAPAPEPAPSDKAGEQPGSATVLGRLPGPARASSHDAPTRSQPVEDADSKHTREGEHPAEPQAQKTDASVGADVGTGAGSGPDADAEEDTPGPLPCSSWLARRRRRPASTEASDAEVHTSEAGSRPDGTPDERQEGEQKEEEEEEEKQEKKNGKDEEDAPSASADQAARPSKGRLPSTPPSIHTPLDPPAAPEPTSSRAPTRTPPTPTTTYLAQQPSSPRRTSPSKDSAETGAGVGTPAAAPGKTPPPPGSPVPAATEEEAEGASAAAAEPAEPAERRPRGASGEKHGLRSSSSEGRTRGTKRTRRQGPGNTRPLAPSSSPPPPPPPPPPPSTPPLAAAAAAAEVLPRRRSSRLR